MKILVVFNIFYFQRSIFHVFGTGKESVTDSKVDREREREPHGCT